MAGPRPFSNATILRHLAGHAFRPVALATFLLAPDAACAHATWADGTSVPDWVAKACCGPSDAHHLRPDQVRRVPGGYMIDGYPRIVHDFQASPSQDGEYWAFYGTTRDADGQPLFTSIFCFFAPSWG